MKKTKVVLAMVCAVLLVAASVMGTLAYLTSTSDTVTNTFTVGDNVVITLDEAKTDEYGNPMKVVETDDQGKEKFEIATNKEEAKRVGENTYKLMPGHKYIKDPTVHVKGNDCYVFVVVQNGIEDILDATTINNQIENGDWDEVTAATGSTLGNIKSNEKLYIYKKAAEVSSVNKTVAKKNDNLVVFNDFTVKGTIENDGFKQYANANVTIKAYAVQTVDFENKTPAEIWNATFGKPATTPATPDSAE